VSSSPAQRRDFRVADLSLAPFSLGEPLDVSDDHHDSKLAIWRLK
jgi:hypothetical protein